MLDKFVVTIPVSGEYVAGNAGNSLVFLTSNANVNLRLENEGVSERFDAVNGGIYIRRVKPWRQVRFLGAAGTIVQFFVGTEVNTDDETDIRLAVTAIAGSVTVIPAALQNVSNLPPVVQATAGAGALIAANPTRVRARITVDSNNTGSCFLRTAVGGNNIMELQPGSEYDWNNTAACFVRNDTGANATFYICEEN